jgi:acetoacetyl-CoA synthetase
VTGDAVSTLCAVYEDVLQVSPIGPDDNFFELGGSSLLIARLFQSIHERLGKDLAMSSVFHAPTPRALAEFLREDAEVATGMVVVLSQPADGGRPVFFIHDLTGDVLAYRRLAMLLGGERSIYGIRAKGLDHRLILDETVEDMAESAIDAMRLVQPHGPYDLIGYSFGGIVAFEMAQRLVASGTKVSLLGLVDTYLGHRALGRLRGLFFIVVVRQVWRVRRLLRSPVEEMHRLTDVILSRTRRGKRRPASQESDDLRTPLQRRVQAIADRELLRYRPHSYPGSIRFFRASERFWHLPEPTTIWRRVAKEGVGVTEVEGGHLELMTSPYVEKLAAHMRRFLSQVQD